MRTIGACVSSRRRASVQSAFVGGVLFCVQRRDGWTWARVDKEVVFVTPIQCPFQKAAGRRVWYGYPSRHLINATMGNRHVYARAMERCHRPESQHQHPSSGLDHVTGLCRVPFQPAIRNDGGGGCFLLSFCVNRMGAASCLAWRKHPRDNLEIRCFALYLPRWFAWLGLRDAHSSTRSPKSAVPRFTRSPD